MRMLPLDSLVEEGSKSLTIWVSPIALPPPYSLMGISSIDRWTLKTEAMIQSPCEKKAGTSAKLVTIQSISSLKRAVSSSLGIRSTLSL